MLHPLSREDGCVVYNCCWSSPVQSFSGPSPAVLMTTFYCLRFETPPTLYTFLKQTVKYQRISHPRQLDHWGLPLRVLGAGSWVDLRVVLETHAQKKLNNPLRNRFRSCPLHRFSSYRKWWKVLINRNVIFGKIYYITDMYTFAFVLVPFN
jgi:hypothetical protein